MDLYQKWAHMLLLMPVLPVHMQRQLAKEFKKDEDEDTNQAEANEDKEQLLSIMALQNWRD